MFDGLCAPQVRHSPLAGAKKKNTLWGIPPRMCCRRLRLLRRQSRGRNNALAFDHHVASRAGRPSRSHRQKAQAAAAAAHGPQLPMSGKPQAQAPQRKGKTLAASTPTRLQQAAAKVAMGRGMRPQRAKSSVSVRTRPRPGERAILSGTPRGSGHGGGNEMSAWQHRVSLRQVGLSTLLARDISEQVTA